MVLTLNQAEDILTNTLKIDDWKFLLQDDKVAFLTALVRSHIDRIPFQNITHSSTAAEDRRNPTEDDILQQGLAGKGGVCIDINQFVKFILCALGFDAFPVTISWSSGLMPGTHFGVVVQLSITESYLIDVGCGLPLWEPVPLHQLPYRRTAGGYPFEFRRTPEGLIQRLQIGGSYFHGKFVDVGEKLQYTFSPTPSTFDSFEPAMQFTFMNPRSILHKQAFMCRQFPTSTDPNVSPNFYIVWGRKIVCGFPDRTFMEEYPDYDDQWKSKIMQYFRNINPDELDRAIVNFKTFNQPEYRY